MGTKDLPLPSPSLNLKACEGQKTDKDTIVLETKDWLVHADFVGSSKPLATQRNLFGYMTEYVIPYTEKTSLFKIKLKNKSNEMKRFPLSQFILKTPLGNEMIPYNLEFFKTQWPTAIIENEGQLMAQSQAIGHVIRTLYTPMSIQAGGELGGLLAYPKLRVTGGAQVQLGVPNGSLCWQVSK